MFLSLKCVLYLAKHYIIPQCPFYICIPILLKFDIILVIFFYLNFACNIGAWFLMGYQHETELLEESLALPRFLPFSGKFGSSEDEFVELDDISRPPRIRTSGSFMDANAVMLPSESIKSEYRQQLPHGWLHKMVFIFLSVKIAVANTYLATGSTH